MKYLNLNLIGTTTSTQERVSLHFSQSVSGGCSSEEAYSTGCNERHNSSSEPEKVLKEKKSRHVKRVGKKKKKMDM